MAIFNGSTKVDKIIRVKVKCSQKRDLGAICECRIGSSDELENRSM